MIRYLYLLFTIQNIYIYCIYILLINPEYTNLLYYRYKPLIYIIYSLRVIRGDFQKKYLYFLYLFFQNILKFLKYKIKIFKKKLKKNFLYITYFF